jgi:hypothetical protein
MKRHNLDNAEIIENISLSMKSILGDYPSENDKYNIVNDRTLTIQMPNLTDGIKEIVNNETKKSAWYTLEGVQLSEKPQHPGVYIYQGRKHVIK